MKKTLLTVIVITLLVTLCACTNMAPLYNAASQAGATSEPITTKEPEPTKTPDVQPTPVVTAEPEETPAPKMTIPPIPEGFSDAELMEKAKDEISKVQYASYVEEWIDGSGEDYERLYNAFLGYRDDDLLYNKVITAYDSEGNARQVKCYLDDKEVLSVDYSHFGTLTYEGGSEEPSWGLWSPLSYVEKDAQGRKVVALTDHDENEGYFYAYAGGTYYVYSVKFFYAYDDEGRLISKQEFKGDSFQNEIVYAYDEEGRLASEQVLNSEKLSQTVYGYDEGGNLITVDGREKYRYTWDEKGRIASVTCVENAHEPRYELKYFENGPVLMSKKVQKVQNDDEYVLEDPAYIFLPSTEVRNILETGKGFAFDLWDMFELATPDTITKDWPDLMDIDFEAKALEYCRYPAEEGLFLSRIAYTYAGYGEEPFDDIIKRLLAQKELPLDETVYTSEGAYNEYENDRLTYCYYYGGGGGSPWSESIKYDDAGRPTKRTVSTDGGYCYEMEYNDAGHISKVTYELEPSGLSGDEDHREATVTYTYDESGELTGMTGEFSYEYTDENYSQKRYRQKYYLKRYE